MNAIAEIKYTFGTTDRIMIKGEAYRWVKFEYDHHYFQRVPSSVEEQVSDDDFLPMTDQEVHTLFGHKKIKVEEQYFSKALTELRMRQDGTDLADLTEEEVRTLFWKQEWCVRFNRAKDGLDGYPFRPNLTHASLEIFIDLVKDDMARWYFRRYGVHRRPGRPIEILQPDNTVTKERKPHDFPGPTALRNWIRRYKKAEYRLEAFMPQYHRCGHRAQLHPQVEAALTKCIKGYKHLSRPAGCDILDDIAVELAGTNAGRPFHQRLKVSITTVNKRIAKLNPFSVEAGRHGIDQAIRKYGPVGQGVQVTDFLERVEIDDWTVDLFTLICKRSEWRSMSKEQRLKIPRVRATVTVAIDCATRCIVGLNISEAAPTTAAAKAAAQSIMIDKDQMATLAGAKGGWPMQGRPRLVVTDGGPVFRGEFEETLKKAKVDRVLPDRDPRMRGYVEAVNKTLKAFCRYFTGQSFANVVEKGDYRSEAMASLTFEAFRSALIQFVVDKYHRRPHRGLAEMSPYGQWEMLTGGRRAIPMDDVQRIAVFGFKQSKVRLDKHGVTILNASYWSPEAGVLFTMLGDKGKVDVFVDPSDIGRALVHVPRNCREELNSFLIEHRIKRESASTSVFLVVPSADTTLWGKSLVEYAEERAELRAAALAAQEKDESFRLHAHESLSYVARKAAREAGIPDHLMTQRMWEVLVGHYRRKAIAATPMPDQVDNHEDADDNELPGQSVAKGKSTGSRGSMRKVGKDKKGRLPPDRDTRPTATLAVPVEDDFGIQDMNAIEDDE